MTRAERRARRAALNAAIEQQRLDLLVEAERWQQAARPLAAGWHTLQRYRLPALGGAGLTLWWTLRRPGRARRLGRLGRRALGAVLLARRFQRLLPRG